MRLEDLREQVEHEKHEYETWKKRAVEKQSKIDLFFVDLDFHTDR